MKRSTAFLLAVLAIAVASVADGQTYTVLGSFNGDNGANPQGGLTAVGSTLFGMTSYGGANGDGTVFSINTDGSGFQNRLTFSGTNGANPLGSLTASGSTLYGMTLCGGPSGVGNVFSINTDGTGYQNLLSFSGTNGNSPRGSLTVNGPTLFGMTAMGGVNGDGNVFSIKTDGSGYQNLFSFSGTNGSDPAGGLTLSGSTLYGTTSAGGTNAGSPFSSPGTVFRINTDGTSYQCLVSFSPLGYYTGYGPEGNLTLSGSTLYGATWGGGVVTISAGSVFAVKTDGSGFQNLVTFDPFTGSNGHGVTGTLVLAGSTLYGTTEYGGPNNDGVLFSVKTDGSDFQLLHTFTGTDGANPSNGLLLVGSTLYGMTAGGGPNNEGVIFSYVIPEPSTAALLAAAAVGLLGCARR